MKPAVNLGNLYGPEGNAFVILGRCQQAARDAGWTKDEISAFFDKTKSGDYGNLLKVVKENFDVFVTGRPVRMT